MEKAGLVVSSAEPTADEALAVSSRPMDLARARSELKGLSLLGPRSDQLAISADQVLEYAGQAYGKVSEAAEASRVLRLLSGHVHELHAAYSLILYPQGQTPQLLLSRVVTAKMRMRALSDAEIAAYVATEEWRGCAGCYQYENRGVQLFESVDGDLSTIIGLPMPELLADLRSLGINPLLSPAGPWQLSYGTRS